MGIRKRGKRTWFVDVYDGKGRRIRRSVGTSKAVAELVEKDLQVKIARGQYLGIFDTNGTPFSEYAKEWLERKKMNVSAIHMAGLQVDPGGLRPPALREDAAVPDPAAGRRGVPRQAGSALRQAQEQHHGAGEEPLQRRHAPGGPAETTRVELIRRFKEEKPLIDPFSFPEMKAFLDARRSALRRLLHDGVSDRDAAQRDAGAEVAPRRLRHALHHDPRGTRPGDRGPAQDALLLPGRRHARPAPPGPSAAPGRLPARCHVRLPEQARQPAGRRQPAQQGLVPGAARKRSFGSARCTRRATPSPA